MASWAEHLRAAGVTHAKDDKAWDATVSCVLKTLEQAIHEILYCRGVYAEKAFANVSTQGNTSFSHICKYPSVRNYVEDVLCHAKPLLLAQTLSKISVLLNGAGGVVVEKIDFAFKLESEKNRTAPKPADRIRQRGAVLLNAVQMALDPNRRATCGDLERQGAPFDVVISTDPSVDPHRDVPNDWIELTATGPAPAVRSSTGHTLPQLEAMKTKVKLGPLRMSWSFTQGGHANLNAKKGVVSQDSIGQSQFNSSVYDGREISRW